MTPEQKIKRAILAQAATAGEIELDGPVTADNVDELFDQTNDDWSLQDRINDMRCGQVETDLPCPPSRHYEAKAVAAKIDGEWIGWTHWYGGGKHGEPEAVDWMPYAYLLECKEEERTVVVQTFTKVE